MLNDYRSENKINFYKECNNIMDTINCIKAGFIKDKLKIITNNYFLKKSTYYLIDLILIQKIIIIYLKKNY